MKIGWSHVVIDLVDKEKNFKEDTLMDWEPVERFDDRGDMF